ncbi:hypothetical protein J3Q64DRAFT_1641945 [Phycomyces blakesleeanus]|uniref:Actin-like ATPase domain-containing protein n=1 Tax=Phycomyces blakesleeanus TaxID=4837 RepID=A0ABR3AVM1_PHYBL
MTSSTLEFYPKDFPYVVGIDFGTTFSGCSCVFADDDIDEMFDITEWSRRGGSIYPKVPTASFYEQDTKTLVAWGYEAIRKANLPNSKGSLITKFKLLLDTSIQTSQNLPNGLTTLQVIADYLRAFYKHVHEQFQTKLGAVYDNSKFRYCLTVPAIWDDRAKATMREAAIIAGIVSRSDHPDRLMLTSEPEAAALYCEKKSNQFNLSHEQRFMICDAGGGTVDLIVFEIEDSSGVKSLREVTKGSGGSCGSTFLDKNMQKLIEKRFGSHAKNNKAAIQYLMDHFVTTTKPEFENEDDEYFTVPAVLNLRGGKMSDIGVDDGRLCISVDELREDVFEPVVKQVLNLISGQINQSQKQIDAIFLVGGFGQSRYLGKRVQDTFKDKVGNICVPSRGEISVMRGAVMFGVDPAKVSHRILRRTYGIHISKPFDSLLDPPEKKYTAADGEIRCLDHFYVYATKGECVAMNKCVSKQLYTFYPDNFNLDLFVYDISERSPRFVTDPGVRRVAIFECKPPFLQGVKTNEKVPFTANMYFGKMELLIEVIMKGHTFLYTSAFGSHELEKTIV